MVTRYGRHATPIGQAEYAGPRMALAAAVAVLLVSAGVVLTRADMAGALPTAAAAAPASASASVSVDSPRPAMTRAVPPPPTHSRHHTSG